MLQSDIEKYEADATRLAREIAKHHEDISTWEADFKDATKVHEIENADCIAIHKAYTVPIAALGVGSTARFANVLSTAAPAHPQYMGMRAHTARWTSLT